MTATSAPDVRGAGDAPAAGVLPAVLESLAGRAEQAPGDEAVLAPDGEYSAAALAGRTFAMAQSLAAAGVRAETAVGVALGRSRDTVPALLGVWLLGATAVLMDPAHPVERRRQIARVSDVRVLIGRDCPEGSDADLVLVRPEAVPPAGPPRRPATVDAESIAYLVHTSGSTGEPKAVEIPYRALEAFLRGIGELALPRGGRVLNAVSPAFDGWLWCTLLALVQHGCVVLGDPAAEDLGALLQRTRPAIVNLTPSLLAGLGTALPAGAVLVTAGEHCPPELLERFAGVGRILNVYGPSEATIAATCADTGRGDDPRGIGRPLAGYRARVLDARLAPVPPGAIGELYIGGPGVARGYRGQPGLTAARFPPDPAADDGSRMYRTGDLVQQAADGQLRWLGRCDGQLKIRGFRIEPTEVELVATGVEGVAAAACAPLEATGGLGLALLASPGVTEDLVAAVRQRCARLLPDYLRPDVVAVLAELPTLPTGKRDTAAVAAALAEHIGRRATGGRPAGTRWERLVIEEFKAQLGEQVQDVDADFFELGGHSLLAARVVAALRSRTGLPVSMRHLLEQPTTAAVGAALAELDASAGA